MENGRDWGWWWSEKEGREGERGKMTDEKH